MRQRAFSRSLTATALAGRGSWRAPTALARVAILAMAMVLALPACSPGGGSKSYDIALIFPLSKDKCAKYDGKAEGSGITGHCWVTRDDCQRAAEDWRQAMKQGYVDNAVQFTCTSGGVEAHRSSVAAAPDPDHTEGDAPATQVNEPPTDAGADEGAATDAGAPEICSVVNQDNVAALTQQAGPFEFGPGAGADSCEVTRVGDGLPVLTLSSTPMSRAKWTEGLSTTTDDDGKVNCCMPDGGKFYTTSGGAPIIDGASGSWIAFWWRDEALYQVSFSNFVSERTDVIVAATSLDVLLRERSN